MHNNYSPEDLICYLYGEASPEIAKEIETALQNDWTLREKLSVLKASYERLNTLIEAPRTEVVLNILRYADQKDVVNS
ncbi:MAG TPA: hypothetical protein VNA26_09845 [Chitinophagaceae bacterium]|nr:hypothetical protein [Chitinophagaceae bacterium]